MKTRIKELRTLKKMSQTALAMEIGCSQSVISKIELENAVPNGDILCKIAEYFHTSVDYLLYKSNQRYEISSSSPHNDLRINEYMCKLQSLSSQKQEILFNMIDILTEPENMR